jgi:hypothetical protein
MAPMGGDPYQLYLARFAKQVGEIAEGAYGKHEGKLIKKLSPAEFAEKWAEFIDLRANYESILENGYTISNVLMKVLRERAAELIVDPPKDDVRS